MIITKIVIFCCPVSGFWDEPDNKEIAIEGKERTSIYECYKSHHQYRDLIDLMNNDNFRIISVIRDPRDISISGSNYFINNRYRYLKKIMSYYSFAIRGHYCLFETKAYRLSNMIKAVIYGNDKINPWLKISWKDYVEPYVENGVFVTKYEDMLDNPHDEAVRILSCIGLERTDRQIENAIDNQSFNKAKERFLKEGNKERYKLLREGTKEQWKSILTGKQKQLFEDNIGPFLSEIGYDDKSIL